MVYYEIQTSELDAGRHDTEISDRWSTIAEGSTEADVLAQLLRQINDDKLANLDDIWFRLAVFDEAHNLIEVRTY